MNFDFKRLDIPEVVLVTADASTDARGFFSERYKRSVFAAAGIEDAFVQDNHSYSGKNVLRGLHYQAPPKAHSKLVSVILGEILDIAVDIRRGSPSYGRYVSAVLSGRNRRQLYLPPGFAHGFRVLSDEAHVVYKLSSEHSPEHDRGILWNDPAIGIDWGVEPPVLSERDRRQPALAAADTPFVYGETA